LPTYLCRSFRGLEEVVFVILFDDAEFFRIVQGTEMNRRGIDGRGDIHEFQAKRAAGKDELANIAHKSDVGVVDGNVQIGLDRSGLWIDRRPWNGRVLFLRGIDFVTAGRRIRIAAPAARTARSGNHPKQPSRCLTPGIFITFTRSGFAFSLRTMGRKFLHWTIRAGPSRSWMRDAIPGQAAVAGFKALGIPGVPNRGVQRIGGANTAKILRQR